MKKILLFIMAVILVSVAAFAGGSGPNGMWLCEDHPELDARPHCDVLVAQGLLDPTSNIDKSPFKCCWKYPPNLNQGGAKGAKSAPVKKGVKTTKAAPQVKAPAKKK